MEMNKIGARKSIWSRIRIDRPTLNRSTLTLLFPSLISYCFGKFTSTALIFVVAGSNKNFQPQLNGHGPQVWHDIIYAGEQPRRVWPVQNYQESCKVMMSEDPLYDFLLLSSVKPSLWSGHKSTLRLYRTAKPQAIEHVNVVMHVPEKGLFPQIKVLPAAVVLGPILFRN